MSDSSREFALTDMRQRFAERWPNFTVEEIFSPGCIEQNLIHKLNPSAMDCLQWLRDAVNRPIIVNFGTNKHRGVRLISENQAIGGAVESMHCCGSAFDISIKGMAQQDIVDAALEAGFTGIGLYPTWVHVDYRLVERPVIFQADHKPAA